MLTLEQITRSASNFSVIEKIHHLRILEEALERKLNKIKYLAERNATNFKLCKIGIIVQKSLGESVFEKVYEYVGTNYNVKYKNLNRTGHRYFNKVEGDLSDARLMPNERSTKDGDDALDAIPEIDSDQEEEYSDNNDIYWYFYQEKDKHCLVLIWFELEI